MTELDPSRESKPRNNVLCCFDFVRTIKNGDLFLLKKVQKNC